MPRIARLIPPKGYLHVICRGNNRRKLFRSERNYKAYYAFLKKVKEEESVKIFHYCFMPNHVHFLVGVREDSQLSRFIKRLNLTYSAYYRYRYNYSGYLWQGRFRSKIIKDEDYFLQCGKYIELNPVRANMAQSPKDYAFSSYLHYAHGVYDEILDEDPLYCRLGKNSKEKMLAYQRMIIPEDLFTSDSKISMPL
ncbi:MAG: transposase [Candidatus Omnitrophota bacterium]|nr:MAG: transposase [Candidatus Omnitrophota bacterium]